MTITREQVADLREGDVVEVAHEDWPEGTVVRGPLWMMDGETLQVARVVVKHWDGRHPYDTGLSLTVISRAPRPLYVNHPRTEPAFGDTAGWEGDQSGRVYWRADGFWLCNDGGRYDPDQMPNRLRLLVDGETGQVVP